MARRISHSRHLQNPKSLSPSLPAYSIECALLSFSPLSFSFHFFQIFNLLLNNYWKEEKDKVKENNYESPSSTMWTSAPPCLVLGPMVITLIYEMS